MVNPLTATLAKVFRDRSQWTSLERLRREGHQKVRVLDVGTLDLLIGQAVERALPEGIDPSQGQFLARSAQVEFVRLLGEKESLERTTDALRNEQESLLLNVETAREALEQARHDLDRNLARQQGELLEELVGEAGQAVDALFARTREDLGDEQGRLAHAFHHVRGSLLDRFRAILLRALREGRGGIDGEESGGKIALLERRISKLSASLGEANQLLSRLQDGGAGGDDGVASVYRDVQGLKGTETHFEHRKELLREMFQMNLELRQHTQKTPPAKKD